MLEKPVVGGTCGFILQTERRTKIRNKNVAIRVVFSCVLIRNLISGDGDVLINLIRQVTRDSISLFSL